MSSAPAGLTFRRLKAGEGERFSGMTFPAHAHLLTLEPRPRLLKSSHEKPVHPFAVGAFTEEGEPAALALLLEPQAGQKRRTPELLSLFVAADLRQKGVATALLEAVEKDAEAAGYEGVRTVYTTGKSYQPIIERLFELRSWRPPFKRMHVFRLDTQALYDAMKPLSRLRKGYEMLPWTEVTEEEQAALVASDWLPGDLSPEAFHRNVDEHVSLGLRYRGELVGWLLVHRISKTMCRTSSAFVRPDLARVAALVPLLAEGARRCVEVGIEKATFTTVQVHPQMTRFALRRMADACYSVVETRGVETFFSDE